MVLVGGSEDWGLREQAGNLGKTGFSKVVRVVCLSFGSFG